MSNKYYKKIYNQEVNPPSHIWDNISYELDKKQDDKAAPWYKNRALWMLPLLALLGFGVYGLLHLNSENTATQSHAKEKLNTRSSTDNQQYNSNTETLPSSDWQASDKKTSPKNSVKTHTNQGKISAESTGSVNGKIFQMTDRNSQKVTKATSVYKNNISDSEESLDLLSSANDIIPTAAIEDLSNANKEDSKMKKVASISAEEIRPTESEESQVVLANNILDKEEIADFEEDEEGKESELDINEQKLVDQHWRLSAFIAPAYSGSFSKNNIWNKSLQDYKGKYEHVQNFGITAQYNINNKWSIRSGLDLNGMKQKLRDVPISFTYSTIDPETELDYIQEVAIMNDIPINSASIEQFGIEFASVNQELKYLGVPVEVGYHFVQNKRFGMGIYGGISTQFLVQNKLTMFTSSQKMVFAEATNLNSVVFGSQLGLSSQFKFSNRFGLNVEPRMVYFWNTFNDGSKVRPFSVNFNFGLNYNF